MRLLLLQLLLLSVGEGQRSGRLHLLRQLSGKSGHKLLERIVSTARPSSGGTVASEGGSLLQRIQPTKPTPRTSILDRVRNRTRPPFRPRNTRAPFRPRISRPDSRLSRPESQLFSPDSLLSRPVSRVPRPESRVSRPEYQVSRPEQFLISYGGNSVDGAQSQYNTLRSDECEALKTENELLKQLVSSVSRAKTAAVLSPLEQAIQQLQSKGSSPPLSPLAAVLGGRSPEYRDVRGVDEVRTMTSTSVYLSTSISHLTRDISLRFQNKWRTTHVVEAVIVTSTVTELFSSVITITPTPSFHLTAVTISPSRPTPPTVPHITRSNLVPVTQSSRPSPAHSRPSPSPHSRLPYRLKIRPQLDSFQSLQRYLQELRDKRERLTEKKKKKVLESDSETESSSDSVMSLSPSFLSPSTTSTPSLPSTSILTVFLSGSVPGVYSTVLSTIILERKRREIQPTVCRTATITVTVIKQAVCSLF